MLILYVEDDFEIRLLVRRIIESMGHEMLEAETGLAGLSIAAERVPDLILMDVNMPGMNGLETTTKLKQHPRLAHIPVIALTGNTEKSDVMQCLAAGCDGYLPKPISVSRLRQQITCYHTMEG